MKKENGKIRKSFFRETMRWWVAYTHYGVHNMFSRNSRLWIYYFFTNISQLEKKANFLFVQEGEIDIKNINYPTKFSVGILLERINVLL